MTDVWCCITALTSMILSVCWTCGISTAFCTSGSQASVVPRTGAVGTWRCIVTATLTILSMYWICVATSRSSARLNRTHLPFVTTGHVHHFVLALHWSISISLLDLLDGGHCLCTSGCRASPRHQLRLRCVFAIFGPCPCITACMISTVFGIFLMVGIRFCIAGSSP